MSNVSTEFRSPPPSVADLLKMLVQVEDAKLILAIEAGENLPDLKAFLDNARDDDVQK